LKATSSTKEGYVKRFISARLLLGACLIVGVSTTVVGDGGDQIQIRLVGFEENPAISTSGRGRLTVEIDRGMERINFRLRYSDLEGVLVPGGVVTQAHIHLGNARTNGGVIAFLCGGGGKPACPSPVGDIEGTIEPADIVGPATQGIDPGEAGAFNEFVRAIRAGATYGNVHTTRWPGGEIRGQLPGQPGRDDHHDHD
jgi:hypothetical protein